MSQRPDHDGKQNAPRALLAVLLLAGAAITVPLGDDAPLAAPAQALLHDECGTILADCGVELELTDWPDSGEPGTTLNGTVTLTNTGDGLDTYTIAISSDNETWTASVDLDETDEMEPDDTATINVTVDVPDDAGLDDLAEINVTATSANDDEVSDSEIFDALSGQIFEWTLGCDDELMIRIGSQGSVALAAVNTGNGDDQGTITATTPEGIQFDSIDEFDLGPGEADERNVTVEVDADVEEGDYDIEWELQSSGAEGLTERCITTVSATQDAVPGNGDGGEEEDSPLSAVFVLVAALGLVMAARRKRQ